MSDTEHVDSKKISLPLAITIGMTIVIGSIAATWTITAEVFSQQLSLARKENDDLTAKLREIGTNLSACQLKAPVIQACEATITQSAFDEVKANLAQSQSEVQACMQRLSNAQEQIAKQASEQIDQVKACSSSTEQKQVLTAPPIARNSLDIRWNSTANNLGLCSRVDQTFSVTCPPGGALNGCRGGGPIYACSSSICTAAVHAGLIKTADGGTFKITMNGVSEEKSVGNVSNGVQCGNQYSNTTNFTIH